MRGRGFRSVKLSFIDMAAIVRGRTKCGDSSPLAQNDNVVNLWPTSAV
jgi:hypothetical protein